MNLDDLMDVWQSQDASPLHGVNEALLRMELRQDEAKLQRTRRGVRWFIYVLTAWIVARRGQELSVMIDLYQDGLLSRWDFAIPIVGAAAALGFAFLVYLRQRAQAVREQHFGDSLRDQINRQLAQLDYLALYAGKLPNLIAFLLLPIVCAFAIILASGRIHGRSFSDVWMLIPIVFMIGWTILCVGGTFLWLRRVTERKTLPRKRRLEALLKELDAP
jgi:hypothetical protein